MARAIDPRRPLPSLLRARLPKPKKPEAPKRELSFDPREERRKNPRISLDELSQKGVKALKERGVGKAILQGGLSAAKKFFNLLDVPRNTIANIIGNIVGVDRSRLAQGTFQKKVFVSDILKKLGVKKGAVRTIAGFAGDIAIDPLTFLTAGAVTGTRLVKDLPKILKPASRLIRAASQTGRFSDDLARAIANPARIKKIERGFQALVKRVGPRSAAKRIDRFVRSKLVKNARRGDKGALEFFQKFGQQGRSLLRVPFTAKGFPILKGGAKGRKFRQVVEGLEGGRKFGEIAAVKRGAKQAALGAGLLGAKAEVVGLGAAEKLVAATKKVSATQSARGQALAAIGAGGGTREVLRTGAVRAAEKKLQIAQKGLAQLRKQGAKPVIKGLQAKFEVTPGGLKALQRATGLPAPPKSIRSAARLVAQRKKELAAAKKGVPRIRTLTPAQQAVETPVRLAKTELAGVREIPKRVRRITEAAGVQSEIAARRANALSRLRTAPDAPGIVKERLAQFAGPPTIRNAEGFIPKLRAIKRGLFGPGPTPLNQQLLAVKQRGGPGSIAKGNVIARTFQKESLEPVVARLAQETGRSADDVRQTIAFFAEAGPGGAGIGRYYAGVDFSDPIIDFIRKNQQIVDDPGVKNLLGEVFERAQTSRGLRLGAGEQLGKLEPFKARLTTKEARQQFSKAAGQEGFRIPAIERAHWRIFELPDGATEKILSSGRNAKAKLARMKEIGAKEVDKKLISELQWNEWGKLAPGDRPAALGPDFPGTKKFTGDMFRPDLAESVGTEVVRTERTLAAADMGKLVEQFGVKVTDAQRLADPQRFANLAFVRAKPSPGSPFKLLERTGLFEKMYPTEVANLIEDMVKVWGKSGDVNALLKATDTTLGFWKSAQLFHPAYVIRNIFQNFFGGLMAGANPIAVAKRWADPNVRLLRKALVLQNPNILRGVTIPVQGRNVQANFLYNALRRFRGVGGGRVFQQIPGTFAGRTGVQQLRATGGRGLQGLYQSIFKWNAAVEDGQRIGTFLHFMDKGMDTETAFLQTLRAMPDLADLTHWEKTIGKRIFPWYAWMRRNGGLQLFHHLPNKPAFAASMSRLQNFAEGFRQKDSVPDELRPMWMQEQGGLQITGGPEGGTALLTSTTFPFEDIAALGAPLVGEPEEGLKDVVSKLRPGLRFPFEAATGRSLFKGTPLTPLREAGLGAIPRALAGRSGTALDVLGALRPIREVGRVAGMPTLGRKIGRGILGGALQPLDAQRGLEARFFELNGEQRKLRSQINRALQVGDQALADNLTDQWVGVLRRMFELGFPVPKRFEQVLQQAGVQRRAPI